MPLLRILIGVFFLGLGLAAQSPGAWAQASDPDLNNDGVVNILDISLVGSCFGADLATNPQCEIADVDGDGDVDMDDLMVVVAAFGQEFDVTPPVVTIIDPVPKYRKGKRPTYRCNHCRRAHIPREKNRDF